MLSIWELQVTTFQTPEDWVQVMTTMDEKGNFPSCDPLFATLTAEVLERDIVIVQADVGPNAPVSANTIIKETHVSSLVYPKPTIYVGILI